MIGSEGVHRYGGLPELVAVLVDADQLVFHITGFDAQDQYIHIAEGLGNDGENSIASAFGCAIGCIRDAVGFVDETPAGTVQMKRPLLGVVAMSSFQLAPLSAEYSILTLAIDPVLVQVMAWGVPSIQLSPPLGEVRVMISEETGLAV